MEKTLFILGAGASKDFCRIFPTGLELIKDINYHFLTEKKNPAVPESNGIYLSALMNDIVRTFGNEIELFSKIKNQLWNIQLDYEHKYLRNKSDNEVSIDNFIKTKINERELDEAAENIIKYSIYYLIKGSEEAFADGIYDHKNSWIGELTKILSNYDIDTIKDNVTIITFNYDRTFEKYFAESLNETFPLSSDQIIHFQNSVHHAYGSLGTLKEIPIALKNAEVETIKRNYQRIKLIGDRENIKLPILNADKYRKVYFLGFGYDKTNINLINLEQFTSASFHGTAYNYTSAQIQNLKEDYNIYAEDISVKNYVQNLSI